MIIWLGNEECEVEELTNQLEFDIVSLEAIIGGYLTLRQLRTHKYAQVVGLQPKFNRIFQLNWQNRS